MRAHKSAAFALVASHSWSIASGGAGGKNRRNHAVCGARFGSRIPVGAALTFPVTSKLSVETDVAYRRAEGNIGALSLSAGLLYDLPRVGQSTPYVAAGLGLSQYGAPVFSSSGRPIGTQPRVAMTVNAGGGLKMPMNEKLDLRTDARWFNLLGQGGEGFRVSQGISFGVGKR